MDPLYGQRSTYPKGADLSNKWVLVDAKGQVLGRLVSQVANILMGKTKPNFQPGAMVGDRVVIINAAEVKTTGAKMEGKSYWKHTGFFGGFKTQTMEEMMSKSPEKVFLHALKGMLPKNSHGRKLIRRVKIVDGANHGMEAQNPTVVTLAKL